MFLTVLDLANLLGISRASAYELVRQENFPKLKIVQGRTIIPRDRLLEWLDEQTRYDSLCGVEFHPAHFYAALSSLQINPRKQKKEKYKRAFPIGI